MLLTGQPVHMYDLDKLPKNELVVKDNIDTKVKALDEKEYQINEGDLVVTSNNIPVCIAGVMGLENVSVTEKTKNICLEVAHFYGPRIRKTSSRLGLSSDSSMRYIKGINLHMMDETLIIATKLIHDLASCNEISYTNTYDELDKSLKEIKCSVSYINNRLSSNVSKDIILDTLKTLYFDIKEIDEDNFIATVPPFRNDIEGKADLSEEIVRYLGFDIITTHLPLMETSLGGRSLNDNKVKIIKDYLLNQGLYEILTYTLLSEKESKYFNILNKDEPYVIMNPLTEDHKVVRKTLLTSLINTICYNLNYQNKNFGLFEVSNIETKKENSEYLAIGLVNKKLEMDLFKSEEYSFYDLKGYIYNIFRILNISESRIRLERFNSEEFHPTRSTLIYLDNKLIGVFGELHPLLKQQFGIKKDHLVIGEINLTKLLDVRTSNNKFKEFSKFPSVNRDYAFYLNDKLTYSDIIKEIKKGSNLIKDIKLFDIYKDQNGLTSIALTVTLEKDNGSFLANEITDIDLKIKDIIVNKLHLNLRG